MGYFSNGNEGLVYEERYCLRCVHDADTCPVLALHSLWNYQQEGSGAEAKAKKEALSALIPIDERGFNLQCRMFRAKAQGA